ncbi:MAG: GxxExxY protein [Candidatus Riflebacteria bacterium]|nr:GxxExxY protein [Candidatus Riflebacteria bacterium]
MASRGTTVPESLNVLSGQIVDAAYRVHARMGPGLLENVYEVCLEYELQKKGLQVERQVPLELVYDSLRFDVAYRLDVVVERQIIVEVKTVETVLPVHKAQLKTYLKLSGYRLGLLLNFNTPLIKDGITRIAV